VHARVHARVNAVGSGPDLSYTATTLVPKTATGSDAGQCSVLENTAIAASASRFAAAASSSAKIAGKLRERSFASRSPTFPAGDASMHRASGGDVSVGGSDVGHRLPDGSLVRHALDRRTLQGRGVGRSLGRDLLGEPGLEQALGNWSLTAVRAVDEHTLVTAAKAVFLVDCIQGLVLFFGMPLVAGHPDIVPAELCHYASVTVAQAMVNDPM
jgi:hypothetical protein